MTTGTNDVTTRLKAKQFAGVLISTLKPFPPRGIRFLTYHSVPRTRVPDPGQMTTPLDIFREQMEQLARTGLPVVSARDAISSINDGSTARRAVVLTFDDGFMDLHDNVLPILEFHRFRATVFVMSDAVCGHALPRESHPQSSYLDGEALRAVVASGLIDVGSHSASHLRLRGVRGLTLDHEIAGSKRDLEDLLDKAVELFAYPFGSFDAVDGTVRRAVVHAGYAGGLTGIAGINGPRTDPFMIRRSRVSWAEGPSSFDRLLRGAYDWYVLVQRLQSLLAAPR